MPKPVMIAGIRFAFRKDAEEHARTILYRGEPGSEVDAADVPFVEALLCVRPDKMIDLQGLNVIRYLRDHQDRSIGTNNWTMCFWAELEDGQRVDFSFKKAIKLLGDMEAVEPAVS